jgi:hypothetical protein
MRRFANTISTLAAAIILSFIIISILTSALVGPYLQATDEMTNVLDFYANNHECDKIYFIGDSYTLLGVNATEVENELNHSYHVYNMAKVCDMPKLLLIDLPNLIESKPKFVVIGTTYLWFQNISYNCVQPAARYGFVADKIHFNEYTRKQFNSTELNLIQADCLHLLAYKRELIGPAIQLANGKIKPQNFKFKEYNLPTSVVNKMNTPPPFDMVAKADNGNKEAFRYLVKQMKVAGIHVIIVNMPLNQDRYKALRNETRKNFRDVVTNVGCPYYDLERLCFPTEFKDKFSHCNLLGQRNITTRVAKILMAEVKNVSQ